MGQHKFNPTAIAFARGELTMARPPRPEPEPRTARLYSPSEGGQLRRARPKVKGKASVKRMKRARMRAKTKAA